MRRLAFLADGRSRLWLAGVCASLWLLRLVNTLLWSSSLLPPGWWVRCCCVLIGAGGLAGSCVWRAVVACARAPRRAGNVSFPSGYVENRSAAREAGRERNCRAGPPAHTRTMLEHASRRRGSPRGKSLARNGAGGADWLIDGPGLVQDVLVLFAQYPAKTP